MAVPLSADRMLAALKAEGISVQEYGSWREHNRYGHGAWGPVNGVVIHHTVSSGDDSSVALCYNGHAALPGPLCHAVGRNDGKVALVGHGRANHAGLGDDDVLQAVIDERALPVDNEANTDGNSRFYGIEGVNLGDGKDTWPWVQYLAMVRWATAICRAHGWSERSVIGHKEWQPGKIDPKGPVVQPDGSKREFTMDQFRNDVRAALALPAGVWGGTSVTAEEEDEVTALEVWGYKNAKEDLESVKAGKGHIDDAYKHLRDTDANVDALRGEVRALTGKVDKIAVGGVNLDALAAKVADELQRRLQQ